MKTCPVCRQPLGRYCLGCGEPLVQASTGRPRYWCEKLGCARLRRRQNPQNPDEINAGPHWGKS
jgi:hypothetical protein